MIYEFSLLAVVVFGLDMVVYGLQLTIATWTAIIPVLHLPGGFTYLPIAAGGVLMVLFALERLALRAAGFVVDHDPNAEDAIMTSD